MAGKIPPPLSALNSINNHCGSDNGEEEEDDEDTIFENILKNGKRFPDADDDLCMERESGNDVDVDDIHCHIVKSQHFDRRKSAPGVISILICDEVRISFQQTHVVLLAKIG